MPPDEPLAQPALDRLEKVLLELVEVLPAALQEARTLWDASTHGAGTDPGRESLDDPPLADDSMTLDQAAEYTGRSLGTVRAAAASGRLVSTQLEPHGRRHTTRAHCDAWLQGGQAGPPRRRRLSD